MITEACSGKVQTMMRKGLLSTASNLSAFHRHSSSTFQCTFWTGQGGPTRRRVDSLFDGCNYEYWLWLLEALPRVKWVLPDSYLCAEESGHGGEPYVEGKVVPYEEKYHADWLRDAYDEDCMEGTYSRKPTRRRRGSRNSKAIND